MNSRSIILSTVALALVAAVTSGCDLLPFGGEETAPPAPPPAAAAPATEPAPAPPPDVKPLKGADALVYADGAVIVNVDPINDHRIEHVDGAVHVELRDLEPESAGWSRTGKILLTSRRTGRARSAARWLIDNGFEDVAYLDGGHAMWTGDYAGENPRDPRPRAKVIYLYGGDPNAFVIETAEDVKAMRTLKSFQQRVAEDYRELERVWGADVDFEIVDRDRDPARTAQLWLDYKIPFGTNADGLLTAVFPQWVLVDKNGRVLYLNAEPREHALARVMGWIQMEHDRQPNSEPYWCVQTP